LLISTPVGERLLISTPVGESKRTTIFVPALNEEENIRLTISDLVGVAERFFDQFEILVFNDASTDRTKGIIDELACNDDRIKAIHLSSRQGLAVNFHNAIAMAKYEYITIVPGDGAFLTDGLANLYGAVGNADMVLSYRTNMREARSSIRYVISRSLTHVVNLLFGLKLIDVHSLAMFPTAPLKKMELISTDAGFFVEILVKLVGLPLSYVVVPMPLAPETHVLGRSLLEVHRGADMFRVLLHLWYNRFESTGSALVLSAK
jgi:dolichol-phosphate mannosyltransferase